MWCDVKDVDVRAGGNENRGAVAEDDIMEGVSAMLRK